MTGLCGRSIEEFSKIQFQCECGKYHSLKTEIVIRRIENGIKKLQSVLPSGKVLLLIDEKYAIKNMEPIKNALNGYTVVTYVMNSDESIMGLFSLPDDIRAIVIHGGETVMNSGRYFASVRNVYSLAIPAMSTAKGLINPLVKIKLPREQNFPANEPDFIVLDIQLMEDYGRLGEGFATASTKSLSILDNKIHAIMTGKSFCKELYALAEESVEIAKMALKAEHKVVALFEANFKFAFCAREDFYFGAERALAKSLAYTLNENKNICEYHAYKYLLEVYELFFKEGFMMSEYTPNYVERLSNASKVSNKSLKSIIKLSKVPLNAEIIAREKLFQENKEKLLEQVEKLKAELPELQDTYYKLGGQRVDFDSAKVKKCFMSIPELTPLISVPTLMRDFGLI